MVIDQSQLASDFAKPRMMLNRYWLLSLLITNPEAFLLSSIRDFSLSCQNLAIDKNRIPSKNRLKKKKNCI